MLRVEKQQPVKSETSVPEVPNSLSIIIPCYNEEATIQGTAETILAYMQETWPQYEYEIILIDDGSTDGTRDVLEKFRESHEEIETILFPFNRGRGEALKAGINSSRGFYVICLDADLSYDEKHIGNILSKFEENPSIDVVVVSPYMTGGTVQGVPFGRLLLSRLANWILAGFFSERLSTVTCVVRGYRGHLIRSVPMFERDKELHLEVLRKLALYGASISEIPGRLIWKEQKTQARRKTNLNFVGSAGRHLLYGMLIKPTRMFKYLAGLLLLIGFYEWGTIVINIFEFIELSASESFWLSLWNALSKSFSNSPHTFVIGSLGLVLGLQAFSYLALLQLLKLQQEETLRHILAILGDRNASSRG